MLDLKTKLKCFVLCCAVLFISAPAGALSLGFNVSSAFFDLSADSTGFSFSQVFLPDERATADSPVSIGTGSMNTVARPVTFFLLGMGMVAVGQMCRRKRLR